MEIAIGTFLGPRIRISGASVFVDLWYTKAADTTVGKSSIQWDTRIHAWYLAGMMMGLTYDE
jgi:hypothetical protein